MQSDADVFFQKQGEGDVTWEAPWNAESVFCIHKEPKAAVNPFQIWHYTLDDQGNVIRAFALGRDWEYADIEYLLAQWNYWCWYMNHGPEELPPPPLYFAERESLRESFLLCMYEMGFQASALFRLFCMPLILVVTAIRTLALWTCRDPIWPDWVEQVSGLAADDPYDQPKAGTPVGWAETMWAQARGDYPDDPGMEMPSWHGEPDGAANARLWAADIPTALQDHSLAKEKQGKKNEEHLVG